VETVEGAEAVGAVTEPIGPSEGPPKGTTARRASTEAGNARRRRAPSLKVTVLAAAAGFLVVFELLASQLRSGNDPAVGSGQVTAQVRPASTVAGTRGHTGTLVTRTSGGTLASTQAAPATASVARPSRASHAITTRSSGGQPGASFDENGYERE
jgi:hypothetical protein